MKAHIIRHGETEYLQEKTTLELANDLTLHGIETIVESALEIAQQLKLDSPRKIQLLSSPFGRCLYSSKVTHETLEREGLEVDPISICDGLSEVGNLDYQFFLKFVNGGDIVLQEGIFTVEKGLTNPFGLKPTKYFKTDKIHRLSQYARSLLPQELKEKIDSIETCKSSEERFQRFLEGLDPNYDSQVLVTHEALTGKLIREATKIPLNDLSKTPFLDRGKYFILEQHGSKWKPIVKQEKAIKYEENNQNE